MKLSDEFVSKGLDAFQDNNFVRALTFFKKALRHTKNDYAVMEAAAYAANKAEEWESAAALWQGISASDPQRIGPIVQNISALIRANRLVEAENLCNSSSVLKERNQKQYLSFLITIFLAQGRKEKAVKFAQKEFELNPNGETLLKYATIFSEHNMYNEAQKWLDLIEDKENFRDSIQVLHAKIFYAKGFWVEAEKAWQSVLLNQSNPKKDNALLFLARIAANRGNLQLAEERFLHVLEDDPENAQAILFLIQAHLRKKNGHEALNLLTKHGASIQFTQRVDLTARAHTLIDPVNALQYYSKIIDQHPNNFTLKVGYAECLLRLKFTEDATKIIVECLEEQPDNYRLNKLYMRLLQMKSDSLLEQLEQAELTLKLKPDDIGVSNTVGSLLARVKSRAHASAHFKSAVKTLPDAAILWRNWAYHTAMDNRLEEAGEIAEKGIKVLGISTAERLTDAARITMAAKKNTKAMNYALKAIKIDPSFVKAHHMAADLQMAEGEYAKAWAHIQKIDELTFPQRTEKVAHIGSQCIAAFRATSSDGKPHPTMGLFPEKLFHSIVENAAPDTDTNRSGILQLTSSLGAGGAERQVAYVMQGMMRNPLSNDPCSLAVSSLQSQAANDFFLPEVEQAGCEIIDLELSRNNSKIRDVIARHPLYAGAIRQLAALPLDVSRLSIPFFAELIERKPRVVHLWQDSVNIAGGIAAVLAGVPNIVLCTRSTHPVEISRHRRYLKEGYHALLKYKGKVTILNNSQNGAHDYSEWLGIDASKIKVFYNGYDFDAIQAKKSKSDRGKIRAKFSIPTKAKVVGGVMRFSVEKRPDLWVATLCAAVQSDPDIHGLIVGDGPMRNSLMDLVAEKGLSDRIHFPGRQSPIEPWMSAMDFLFLSSVTEGLPNVLIEAQSLGVPVVTMDVGGATEAIKANVSGLALEEATPSELSVKILHMLNDTNKMDSMSRNAIKFVNEQFSLDKMVTTLKEFY